MLNLNLKFTLTTKLRPGHNHTRAFPSEDRQIYFLVECYSFFCQIFTIFKQHTDLHFKYRAAQHLCNEFVWLICTLLGGAKHEGKATPCQTAKSVLRMGNTKETELGLNIIVGNSNHMQPEMRTLHQCTGRICTYVHNGPYSSSSTGLRRDGAGLSPVLQVFVFFPFGCNMNVFQWDNDWYITIKKRAKLCMGFWF